MDIMRVAIPGAVALNGSVGEGEEVIKHAARWPPPALTDTV